ncbi:MAG: hypothetical protein EBS90_13275 [Betaproteobacteria bacterium]|nr:hypothetical protein [Betaproteobacteria bacterium]
MSLLEIKLPARRALARRLRAARHSVVLSMALPESEPALERVTLAGELLSDLSGLALLVRPSKRVARSEESGRALLISVRRELPRDFALWVDPGEVFFRVELPSGAGEIHWVADPLWHTRSQWGSTPIHKLHGWHEARWIRYYGDAQLKLAIKRSLQAGASHLLVGHSKREEESRTLSEILGSSSLKSAGQKR